MLLSYYFDISEYSWETVQFFLRPGIYCVDSFSQRLSWKTKPGSTLSLLALLCHNRHLSFFSVAQQTSELLTHIWRLPHLKILGGRLCYLLIGTEAENAAYSLFPTFLYSEGPSMRPSLLQSDIPITDLESGIGDARNVDGD